MYIETRDIKGNHGSGGICVGVCDHIILDLGNFLGSISMLRGSSHSNKFIGCVE